MSIKSTKIYKTAKQLLITVFLSRIFVVLSISLLITICAVVFAPPTLPTFDINTMSKPSINFESGLSKFSKLQSEESDEINQVCKTQLLHHGKKQPKSIVMFHGFTNCPAQYSILSKQLYDTGYNVLLARTPDHGYLDKLNPKIGTSNVYDFIRVINESIDIASGLGEQVDVFGLSGGGSMAAFAGYYRKEVSRVMLAAPLFLPKAIDSKYSSLLLNTLTLLPNYQSWWDKELKENITGPSYGYARYSSKNMLAYLQLSGSVVNDISIKRNITSNKKVFLILAENDSAVDNEYIKTKVQNWVQAANLEFESYVFPQSTGLWHDFIDPNQTSARIDISYPKILELLEKP